MADGFVVEARPVRTGRIANGCAAAVLVAFLVTAALLTKQSWGQTIHPSDQIFTVVLGLILAGGLRLPARPRLQADAESIRFRGYIGDWRTVPWSAVRAVEFPSKVRFARIALGGDESLALYAVQRADRETAVTTMRGLRELFAQTHPGR